MYKFFVGLVMALLLVACAPTQFVPPVECETSQSLILEKFPDPSVLDKSLLTVQLLALEKIDGYTSEDAVAVIDNMAERLASIEDLTYAQLVNMIIEKVNLANALAGGVIFIYGDNLEQLSEPIPVSACDLTLVYKHLQRQRALAQIHGG